MAIINLDEPVKSQGEPTQAGLPVGNPFLEQLTQLLMQVNQLLNTPAISSIVSKKIGDTGIGQKQFNPDKLVGQSIRRSAFSRQEIEQVLKTPEGKKQFVEGINELISWFGDIKLTQLKGVVEGLK